VGNVATSGTVSATGTITGGNVATGGTMSATGNVTGGNIATGGTISATGNINGSGAVFSGNVTAANFIGNISGNIDAAGSNTWVQFNDTGDILGASADFTFDKSTNQLTVTGTITGGNLATGGTASATGNITGGNVNTAGQVVATGNVTGGNVISIALVSGANVTATANVTGANVTATSTLTGGNIVISGDDITDTNGRVNFNTAGGDVDFAVNGDTVANVFYIDAGTGTASFGSATQTTNVAVAFNATTSVLMPVGNTVQRPGTGVTGMLRFNTILNSLELYDNSQWVQVGVPEFTLIVDDQFTGDGSTTVFVLSENTFTTSSVVVSINGVVQIPTLAYSVSGDQLTFTEAPQSGDYIDVRGLTTTTQVTQVSNSGGTAVVAPDPTLAIVNITGDLNPTANATYDLGSSSMQWKDLWLSGNTLHLGNVTMKNVAGGNTIAFYGPDGTTPATIASSSIDTTQIANGTSNAKVVSSNGDVTINVGGTSNVAVFTTTGATVNGDLTVTGNATLSGNILGDRVQNGTTSLDIQTQNGNANITVGGTSNVAVFTTGGVNVTGAISATGNITGSYILGNGSLLTGIDATSIQNGTSSVAVIASGGNVRTNIAGATVATTYSGGINVTGVVSATGNITGGNVLGGANVNATTHTGTTVSVTGNVNGGNIISAALVQGATLSATGNITGGNLSVGTGTITVNNIVNGGSNGVGNIGSASTYFNTVFAKATSAQYADLAEMYEADADYTPGQVVEFGGSKEVTASTSANSKRVAGVVSTNPSYLMNSAQTGEFVIPVALQGRVPCRVVGPVRKGDLMVSAGNGAAMSNNDAAIGTVIGKALQDFDGTEGTIEVVVGRH